MLSSRWSKFGVLVFVCLLGWYFFILPFDHLITFQSKTSPAIVYQALEEWAEQSNVDSVKITSKSKYDFVLQSVENEQKPLELHWMLEAMNDSVTQVKIGVLDLENSWLTKLKTPFVVTEAEELALQYVRGFKSGLDKHLASFNIQLEGFSTSKSIQDCSCKAATNIHVKDKAQNMKFLNNDILSFLFTHGVKVADKPFLKVTDWDMAAQLISIEFCFPIVAQDALPPSDDIAYKSMPAIEGIKCNYYGNYAHSDRAWLALLEYAQRNEIAIDPKPIEFYYHNPHDGGNELEWKAEVFFGVLD